MGIKIVQAVEIAGHSSYSCGDFYDDLLDEMYIVIGKCCGENVGDYGARFQLDLPETITAVSSAYLSFQFKSIDGCGSTGPNLKIYAEAADNSAAFSDEANYNARPKTSAVIDWDNTSWVSDGSWQNTCDISSVINEVISRPGWQSGNYVTIFVYDDNSPPGEMIRGYNVLPKLYVAVDSIDCPNFATEGALSADLSIIGDYVLIINNCIFQANASIDSVIAGGVILCGILEEFIVPAFSASSALNASLEVKLTLPAFEAQQTLSATPSLNLSLPPFSTAGSLAEVLPVIIEIKDPVIRFYFTLTGHRTLPNITIPISSFQARCRYKSLDYLSVVIPGKEYAAEIAARPNTYMEIRMAYVVNGVVMQSETIVRVALTDIRIDEGGTNSSITLTGYFNRNLVPPKTITLTGTSYGCLSNGKRRYRCAPNFYILPGDYATVNGDTFKVNMVTWFVGANERTMEVAEYNG